MTDPQAIVQWDPTSGGALPAYLADAMGEVGSNINERQNVPSLSYEGKTWTIVKDGNKEKLQSRNEDGDMVPVQVMRMLILKYNDDRGRAFYEGTYNPAESKQPLCWSPDGKAPSDNAKQKQNPVCNGCPQSIKGSKVDQGREMVACSSHRMIAIVPAGEISMDPLRLKIAVTSDWDKEVVEHGWFAFRQYTDFLRSRGITHTALVVTKVKFDPQAPHPKLLFSIDRPLTPAEVALMVAATKNPKVNELLAEKWTAAGVNGKDAAENDIKPHGLEGALADGWIIHPDAAGYVYKGAEVITNEDVAARYPAPPPPPVKAAAPPPPAAEPTPAAPPPPPAAAAPAPEAPHGLAAAELDGWIAHPSAPGYHYKGDVVEASDKVAAFFPKQEAAAPEPVAPAAPPAPPPAPAPEPAPVAPVKTPAEQAAEAGWIDHPSAPGYMYLGTEVLLVADVMGKFSGAAPAAPAAAASEATTSTAGTGTSPSSPAPSGAAEIPADVQDLLNKWG